MAALLTNGTGVEVQLKFRWQGKNRYINNDYMPNTSAVDWDLTEVMNSIIDESGWVSAIADATHTECVLESITGRVRGRDDAGTTETRVIEQAGLLVGAATPSWLTFNVWQIPDNTNRLIISGTPSLFKRGRIAFPGVRDIDIAGNNLDSSAAGGFVTAATAMMSIPSGSSPASDVAFSLVMNRNVRTGTAPNYTYTLVQRANVLSVVAGKIGTQLTAR